MKKRKTVIKIGGLRFTLPLILILILIIVILTLLLIPSLRDTLGLGKWPTSFSELLPEEVMGYNESEITQALLGETRARQELIVLEQDVSVQMEITRTLANIPLFEKSKTVYAYGTGAFGVDLSQITEETILFDHETKTVTLSIPHARLVYVDPDYSKTEFGDTERALLAFGDIKLTQEQQNVLNHQIEESMTETLSGSNRLAVADLRAVQQVKALLGPILYGVNPDYSLKVIQE